MCFDGCNRSSTNTRVVDIINAQVKVERTFSNVRTVRSGRKDKETTKAARQTGVETKKGGSNLKSRAAELMASVKA